jgi:hypothetical protein
LISTFILWSKTIYKWKFNVLLPILVASGLLPTRSFMVGVISVIVYDGLWVVSTPTERITALKKKYTKY